MASGRFPDCLRGVGVMVRLFRCRWLLYWEVLFGKVLDFGGSPFRVAGGYCKIRRSWTTEYRLRSSEEDADGDEDGFLVVARGPFVPVELQVPTATLEQLPVDRSAGRAVLLSRLKTKESSSSSKSVSRSLLLFARVQARLVRVMLRAYNGGVEVPCCRALRWKDRPSPGLYQHRA